MPIIQQMVMSQQLTIILMLYIFCILFPLIKSLEIIPGNSIQDSLSSSTSKQYTLQLNKTSNTKLIILAEGNTVDYYDAPELTVSTTVGSWKCQHYKNTDECIISPKHLKDESTLTITASCTFDCNYTLKAYYSDEHSLQFDKSVNVDMDINSNIIVFNLDVPTDHKFDEIGIVAEVLNPDLPRQMLFMFADINSEKTYDFPIRPEKFQFESRSIWNDGRGIFLKPEDIKIGDNIKIILYGTAGLRLKLSAYTTIDSVRNLQIGQTISSDVFQQSSSTYKINLNTGVLHENSTVEVQLNVYSGFVYISLSNDPAFQKYIENLTLETYSSMTTFNVLLTPQIKNKFNNVVYMRITGMVDSTYTMRADYISQKNFTYLKHDQYQLSMVPKESVQNYIYKFELNKTQSKLTRMFKITVDVFSGQLELLVRRCKSLQVNNSLQGCMPYQISQLQNASDVIHGQQNYRRTEYEFVFTLDAQDCTSKDNIYLCVIQISLYNSQTVDPTTNQTIMSSNKTLKYGLKMHEEAREVIMVQSLENKYRIEKDQQKYFYFSLANKSSVHNVDFYFSTLSGDCILVISNDTRRPNLDNSQNHRVLVSDGNIKYSAIKDQISLHYYVSVIAEEPSYFTLSVVVNRNSSFNPAIELQDSVVKPIVLQSGQTMKKFYFRLKESTNVILEAAHESGSVLNVSVYASYNQLVINYGNPWTNNPGEGGLVYISNTTERPYSQRNQFVVIVQSDGQPSEFTIGFETQGSCSHYTLGYPLFLEMGVNTAKCMIYTLNKAEDLEVILSANGLQRVTDTVNPIIFINQTRFKMSGRIRQVPQQNITTACPNINSYSANSQMTSTSCNILVYIINQVAATKLYVTVQYTNDELSLMDGNIQAMETNLSIDNPKHFYFYFTSTDTINVVIKRAKKTNFTILAKIVNQTDFAKKAKKYPNPYNMDANVSTDTSGLTILNIRSNKIVQANCQHCYLLLTVFSSSATMKFTNFTIEVTQDQAELEIGDVKQGYIEAGQVAHYRYRINTSTILYLNALVNYCANLNVYILKQNGTQLRTSIDTNSVYMEPANNSIYIVEVQGKKGCNFQLQVTDAVADVSELLPGTIHQKALYVNMTAFYLYHHTIDESFRVVTMEDFGDVTISITVYNASNPNHTDQLPRAVFNKTNQPYQNSLLMMKAKNQTYCSNCTYLIKVTAVTTASFMISVQVITLPIPLREDKSIKEKVPAPLTFLYSYRNEHDFSIHTAALYGAINIQVFNGLGERVMTEAVFKNMAVFSIPPSNASIDSPLSEYNVRVTALSDCVFTLSIKQFQQVIILKYNVPVSIRLENNTVCGTFLGVKRKAPYHLIIQFDNSSDDISYNLSCNVGADLGPSQIGGGCEINNTAPVFKNRRNINIEFTSNLTFANYSLCMRSPLESLIVNVLVSTNNVKTLSEYSQLMVRSTKDPNQYFEIFNVESRKSALIQAYQCKGKVSITSSSSMAALQDEQTQLILQEIENNGHYILLVDNLASGQYFVKAKSEPNSLYVMKYSFFDGSNPMRGFTVGEKGVVNTQIAGENLMFNFKRTEIEQSSLNVVEHSYIIYISDDQSALQEASMCQTKQVFSRITKYSQEVPEDIKITIKIKELVDNQLTSMKQLYVIVVCEITYLPAGMLDSSNLRFLYQNLKLVNLKPHFQSLEGFKFPVMLLWVGLPLTIFLIILFFLIRFCYRSYLIISGKTLIEEQQNINKSSENNPNDPQTGNVLVYPPSENVVGITAVNKKGGFEQK